MCERQKKIYFIIIMNINDHTKFTQFFEPDNNNNNDNNIILDPNVDLCCL